MDRIRTDKSRSPATPGPTRRSRLGRLGEDAVCAQLVDRGWSIVVRNLRCRRGEIDTVGRDRGALVFCEVKTLLTSGTEGFSPFESIGAAKRTRIRRIAAAWLAGAPAVDGDGTPIGPPEFAAVVRFDAFAVKVARDSDATVIEHVAGAF